MCFIQRHSSQPNRKMSYRSCLALNYTQIQDWMMQSPTHADHYPINHFSTLLSTYGCCQASYFQLVFQSILPVTAMCKWNNLSFHKGILVHKKYKRSDRAHSVGVEFAIGVHVVLTTGHGQRNFSPDSSLAIGSSTPLALILVNS